MTKVTCYDCGKEVKVKDSVLIYNSDVSQAHSICMDCYYKRISQKMEEGETENNGNE